MANLHKTAMQGRELIHTSRIECTLKKWSDYDKCKALHLQPTINEYDFERVFTTETDKQIAEQLMDKLGILWCD